MKKLVIIGGGFAGTQIAQKLEDDFETILIDSKDYFEYTPGILRTIVDPKHAQNLQSLHKNYLKNTKIIKERVKQIDNKDVFLNKEKIKFDYLVIATGTRYNNFKRQNVVLATRSRELIENHKKLLVSKSILIVGGGIVGVELAAEISSSYKNKKIILIHAKSRLMPRENLKSSKYAENFLKNNNVEIIYEERIIKTDDDACITNKGKRICPDLVFMCTGVKPNSEFMIPNFKEKLTDRGYIKTNEMLQLENINNIFIAGDVTNVREEKLAQNAEYHAKVIINNIKNLEKKLPLISYKSKKRLVVISLGKNDGLLNYKKLTITGFFPAKLKSLIEKSVIKKYK